MARVYGEMARLLDADIEARSKTVDFLASFIGPSTEVSSAIAGLATSTNLKAIRGLGIFGDAERARIKQLDDHLTALKAKSPKALLAELDEAKSDITALATRLRSIAGEFSDATRVRRSELIQKAKVTAAKAALLGSDTFKKPFFTAVGTPQWETFAKAAHALGKSEDGAYPRATDHCLLCERPLDEVARAHVGALFGFVESDAQREAAAPRRAADDEAAQLMAAQLPNFSADARVRTHVHRRNPLVETALSDICVSLVVGRDATVAALKAESPHPDTIDVGPAVQLLTDLVTTIDADISKLKAENIDASIAGIELERQTLRHREVLSQLLPQIETQVTNLLWIRAAQARRTLINTRHITEKEKDLFGRFVTSAYRDRFETECNALDCALPVELQTMGRSGQTMRALAMPGGHKPSAILSEGEQKAVALADFLTEVEMNPASAGIILDDPVTSQDHQRKKRIALRLVDHAQRRQVIVFTHDLVFLNQLLVAADAAAVDLTTHWIQVDANGPGKVALGDSPDTDKTHKTTDRAKEALKSAKTLVGSAQAAMIVIGMDALRTTLEVTVATKLLKSTVTRWDEQIRVPALRKINWDVGKVEEICALYEDLSRYIGAHSHSDVAVGAPPEPRDLEDRIRTVEAVISWARPDRK